MVRVTRAILGRVSARLSLAVLASCAGIAAWAGAGWAAEPKPWEIGMQPPATPIKEHIQAFHNELLVIIFLIAGFVLGLLLYVMVRFSAKRHPVPTRTSHNPLIEFLWTVIPVVVLIIIAIPSFKLMYFMDEVPNAAMTIKVTGQQWNWTYDYPDQGGISFVSQMIEDKDLKPGQKRLLDVDNPLVVPVQTTVRVQVTGDPKGVIHSWFVPSFGVQEYAVPGRLNEAWFRVEHEGTYYGECNQICGVNHAFMPIAVKAVSKADFQKWLVDAKKKYASNPPDPTAGGEGDTPVAGTVETTVAAAGQR